MYVLQASNVYTGLPGVGHRHLTDMHFHYFLNGHAGLWHWPAICWAPHPFSVLSNVTMLRVVQSGHTLCDGHVALCDAGLLSELHGVCWSVD